MKKLLIGIFILGLSGLSYSQASIEEAKELELDGITVMPANLSYLSLVSSGTEALRVINLQKKVASFDITKSPLYKEMARYYQFRFIQQDDNIFATYKRDGSIVTSQERYKDIILSKPVRKAVYNAYPGWEVESNSYVIYYTKGKDPKKVYRVKIAKGNKHKRLKLDTQGNLL